MRTKEIDVWVTPDMINKDIIEVSIKEYEGDCKAKLIITLPERKIEITESQLDEAFGKWSGQGSCDFYREQVKAILFRGSV